MKETFLSKLRELLDIRQRVNLLTSQGSRDATTVATPGVAEAAEQTPPVTDAGVVPARCRLNGADYPVTDTFEKVWVGAVVLPVGETKPRMGWALLRKNYHPKASVDTTVGEGAAKHTYKAPSPLCEVGNDVHVASSTATAGCIPDRSTTFKP